MNSNLEKFKKLVIFIVILLYSLNCFAAEKADKVRFHPPETEAEKELSSILMYSVDRGNKVTKEYKLDLDNQFKKSKNSDNCKKWNEDCTPWGCDHLLCAQDIPYGFGFYSEKKSNKEHHIIVELIWYGDSRSYVKYIMKNEVNSIKQDIWKLDGICCSGRVYINCPYQAPKYSNEDGDE